jgi:hypothetical protein
LNFFSFFLHEVRELPLKFKVAEHHYQASLQMDLLIKMIESADKLSASKLERYMAYSAGRQDRLKAVQWMTKVSKIKDIILTYHECVLTSHHSQTTLTYGLSSETRDLSIQLLDRFLAESFARNPLSLQEISLTLFAATTSLITASKLLEIQPPPFV